MDITPAVPHLMRNCLLPWHSPVEHTKWVSLVYGGALRRKQHQQEKMILRAPQIQQKNLLLLLLLLLLLQQTRQPQHLLPLRLLHAQLAANSRGPLPPHSNNHLSLNPLSLLSPQVCCSSMPFAGGAATSSSPPLGIRPQRGHHQALLLLWVKLGGRLQLLLRRNGHCLLQEGYREAANLGQKQQMPLLLSPTTAPP